MTTAKPWLTLLLGAVMALPLAQFPTAALAAQADAEVEALQMPAWLTRGGKRIADVVRQVTRHRVAVGDCAVR